MIFPQCLKGDDSYFCPVHFTTFLCCSYQLFNLLHDVDPTASFVCSFPPQLVHISSPILEYDPLAHGMQVAVRSVRPYPALQTAKQWSRFTLSESIRIYQTVEGN